MTDPRRHLQEVVSSVEVRSPFYYMWDGRRFRVPRLRVAGSGGIDRQLQDLAAELTAHLYSEFYCGVQVSSVVARDVLRSARTSADFELALAAANAGAGHRSVGWNVRSVEHGVVTVAREGLTLIVSQDRLGHDGGTLAAGETAVVTLPGGYFNLSPGYYLAVAGDALDARGQVGQLRVYLNLSPAGAVSFMRLATRELPSRSVPYQLKALSDPAGYDRCDPVVLYLRSGDFSSVVEFLQISLPVIGHELRPRVPALTKELVPGIAVAESPPSGESFGQNRCALIADGLARACAERVTTARGRMHLVGLEFAEKGVSVDMPYLNASAEDRYDWPHHRSRRPCSSASADAPDDRAQPELYLATAESIARRICDAAVWHRGRCNWIGVEYVANPRQRGTFLRTYRTLDPTLYSGTSGIAVFLAELSSSSGRADCRETAVAAIRQAVASSGELPPERRLGLFEGMLGIAFAAARVGGVLGSEELTARALEIASKAVTRRPASDGDDLVGGRAGAIVALLALIEMTGADHLLSHAHAFGDELCTGLNPSGDACSWPVPGRRGRVDLTGFAHGTAGIAYALLEFYLATREDVFREVAERAFRYERRCFRAAVGNWPDYRDIEAADARRGAVRYASAWCHGAPGIALSRIRAYEILGDEEYRTEATSALRTTLRSLDPSPSPQGANYSLCHGLAGNADIVLQGRRLDVGDADDRRRQVFSFANGGVRRYGTTGDWPCGAGRGSTPALMLGTAGIGSFYLRLVDGELPSIAMASPLSRFRAEPSTPQRYALRTASSG